MRFWFEMRILIRCVYTVLTYIIYIYLYVCVYLVDMFGGVEEKELLPGSSGSRERGQRGEGAAQRIHDRRQARGPLDVV
jgi:hypothetical protein